MANNKDFSQLNPEQRRAVTTTDGRVLILAGAGSGKTSVLAYRIAYLIGELRVSPKAILGLTFTNKAAKEMRERVASLVGASVAKETTLSTFHSFGCQVLRKEIHHLGYTSHFTLYDEQDVKRLLKQLARHLLEQEGEIPSIEGIYAKFSKAKGRSTNLEEISEEDETWKEPFIRDLFTRFQTCMRAYNAVDFDSLLSLTVELFEKFPAVLQKYQERYRYIMIDEYQDTNPMQYRLAKLLASSHQNLCVVGDDDQSIYGWRGAEIKNILQFESQTIIKLEQNYRSTPTILKAAHAVITRNKERHSKELWSSHETGDPISLFHAPSEMEEAQAVIDRIVSLHKNKKIPWKEMAILYRSNLLSRPFELALMQTVYEKEGKWIRGIPYQIFGGTEFYERSEIKDLLAYMKVIANPLDQESLLRIVNVPRRGISDLALDKITQKNRQENLPLLQLMANLSPELCDELSSKATNGIASFVKLHQEARAKFQTGSLASALEWLIAEIDYKKAISEDVQSDKMRDFKWENVLHCVDVLKRYEEEMEKEGRKEEISLSHFVTNTLLDKEKVIQRDEAASREDKVNLMTFHSAKGLEFTACFLVGLEDHLLPHEKSLGERGVEEERRLFYVALTRAKKQLLLSMARSRKKMGKEIKTNPSRFLFEIPQELIKIVSWKEKI